MPSNPSYPFHTTTARCPPIILLQSNMAVVVSWIAACSGIGVDEDLNSIWGPTEEDAAECVDFLSEVDAGGDVVYRAQLITSAVSDCRRVSVLYCPYTVSGMPAILYGNDQKPKNAKEKNRHTEPTVNALISSIFFPSLPRSTRATTRLSPPQRYPHNHPSHPRIRTNLKHKLQRKPIIRPPPPTINTESKVF
jgi:hypothetical protein